MAKDFSQYEDDNPVMAILGKAKDAIEEEKKSNADENPLPVQPVQTAPVVEPEPVQEIEPKKILMNISIRETTKKEWKMFFLEHDLSMTQGIETAVEFLQSEVKKGNIKLSKGGITR